MNATLLTVILAVLFALSMVENSPAFATHFHYEKDMREPEKPIIVKSKQENRPDDELIEIKYRPTRGPIMKVMCKFVEPQCEFCEELDFDLTKRQYYKPPKSKNTTAGVLGPLELIHWYRHCGKSEKVCKVCKASEPLPL